jgi:hypothetical protein
VAVPLYPAVAVPQFPAVAVPLYPAVAVPPSPAVAVENIIGIFWPAKCCMIETAPCKSPQKSTLTFSDLHLPPKSITPSSSASITRYLAPSDISSKLASPMPHAKKCNPLPHSFVDFQSGAITSPYSGQTKPPCAVISDFTPFNPSKCPGLGANFSYNVILFNFCVNDTVKIMVYTYNIQTFAQLFLNYFQILFRT